MLRVAGIRLALEAPPGAVGIAPFEEAYAEFLCNDGGPADCTIALHRAGALPPLPEGRRLFRHRGQWHACRDARGWPFWPLLVPYSDPRPHRLALGTPDLSRVDLHVSDAFEPGPVNPYGYLFSEVLTLEDFARHPGALVHAAAVVLDGAAWLFPGRSGAGKSTLAALFGRHGGATVLGDENLVLRPEPGGGVRVHGTPWHGTSRLWSCASAPLAGLALLEHAPEERLRPLGAGEAAAGLLSHTYLPRWSPAALAASLDTVAQAVRGVRCGVLSFRPTSAVCDFLCREVA